MARTQLTQKQLHNATLNRQRRDALQTKLAEHDTILDLLVVSEAGFLAATDDGRGVMADDYFNNTTTTDAKFSAGSLSGNRIANLGIDTAQLAANAVTTVKITDANVTAAKLEAALCAAPSERSGPGAIAITSPDCLLTTTGTGDALTLADGGFAGQKITITHIVDGGTGVITQNTGAKLRADIATITWTSVGDFCTLIWTGTLWTPGARNGVTVALT